MHNIDHYKDITVEAMQHTLGLNPRPFQLATISHIIQMNNLQSSTNPIQPSLLVQGTSGGKSSVYQMIGVIKAGVTLIIESMLSLSSDQMSKIAKIADTTEGVSSIQLDSIKKHEQQTAVVSSIQSLKSNTNRTIYLFASPEALTKPVWSSLLKQLIINQTLSLVCIDEVHLYVQFAITFRPSIISLKTILFDLLHLHNPINQNIHLLKVPVLFMTATFNDNMNKLLNKITGLKIEKECIFWSESDSFSRRNINIEVSLTIYKIKVIKDQLNRYLKDRHTTKAIIYSNISSQVVSMREKIDNWLDEPESFDGDTMIINGELPSEWKLVSSQLFTSKGSDLIQKIANNEFVPRILLATSGCIGAGLDSSEVVLVMRDGFPTSMIDFVQEMGRCGRSIAPDNEHNTSIHDCFHIIISLQSLTYLIEHIYAPTTLSKTDLEMRETVISVSDSNSLQLQNLIDVVAFIFNSNKCWHHELEELCAQKLIESNNNEHPDNQGCGNSCPWCTNNLALFIKPINKLGVIQFLVYIFIENNFNNITPMMLCNYLKIYPNVGKKIYGRRVDTPPAIVFLNSTIMQLIGSKLLKTEVHCNEDNNELNTILRLNYIFDGEMEYGRLAYTIQSYWKGFKFIN